MLDVMTVTPEYARERRLPAAELAHALSIFQEQGFVVISRLLEERLIERVHSEYLKSLDAKIARLGIRKADVKDADDRHQRVMIHFEPKGGNHDVNRWNMHLPSRMPFLEEDLIAHPILLQILRAMFVDPVLFIITSDTPLPGSTYQNIHQDFDR